MFQITLNDSVVFAFFYSKCFIFGFVTVQIYILLYPPFLSGVSQKFVCSLDVLVLLMYRFEMKTLLVHYKGRVEFIEGTPLNEFDLDRVCAKMASAVFLMADRQAVVRFWIFYLSS